METEVRIRQIFGDDVKITGIENGIRFYIKKLNTLHVRGLGRISDNNEVDIIRSGQGLTIRITTINHNRL